MCATKTVMLSGQATFQVISALAGPYKTALQQSSELEVSLGLQSEFQDSQGYIEKPSNQATNTALLLAVYSRSHCPGVW